MPPPVEASIDHRVVTRFAVRHGIDLTGCTVHGRDPGGVDWLKPSPWMLDAALYVHGCVPSEALLVGDSTTDVAAAHAAGTPCVGIAVEQERAATLIRVGAVGVVGDLGAFLEGTQIQSRWTQGARYASGKVSRCCRCTRAQASELPGRDGEPGCGGSCLFEH